MKSPRYREAIENRYLIYNSLFLNLPFEDIFQTGTFLPLFEQHCKKGYQEEKKSQEIVESFFDDILPDLSEPEKRNLLFRFIQYVERQVVLFDSVEDAAFSKIRDLSSKGSLRELFSRAKADGLSGKLLEKANNFGLRIVLTAHPTQFYPGQVLAIITDLQEAIKQNNLREIDLILQQLGKTPFIKRTKPTPYDEAVSLCWYLENVYYHIVPEVLKEIHEFSESERLPFTNYDLIKIGFWPGGDRDGNPFVTHLTTLKVAMRLRETVLKCYYRDIRVLRRRITFSGIEDQLQLIERKIFNSVYGNEEDGYGPWQEMETDLQTARNILVEKHNGLFLNLLDDFIAKSRIFGFHMAPLDVRQDSRKHRSLWKQLSNGKIGDFIIDGKGQKKQLNEILSTEINADPSSVNDDFYSEMLSTFHIIKKIQQLNGEKSCNRYIISNSMCPADVMAVFALSREVFGAKSPPLDIAPLFESIDFLAMAPQIMKTLYEQPDYRLHLEARGNKQTIMLGFSDGTKDGGYLQANYSIYKAKEELTKVSRDFGVEVVFFDGRGGPPARGGGNTHSFYASLGPTIEASEIQLTIQGQTISTNFGNKTACKHNLEQLLTAAFENAIYPARQRRLTQTEKDRIQRMAKLSREAYVELKEHESFVPYLERVTPLRFFGKTNIGSRPVKRTGDSPFTFEDLRAIPFVGSWAQMKQNVPGYFGLGSAIEIMSEEGKLDEVKSLYQNSMFFRALIGNSMQSLAKTFYPATTYLKDHPEFGAFWEIIFEEFVKTKKWLKEVSESEEIVSESPISSRSIQIRERIVLPLIAIQQYALQRLLYEENQLKEEDQVFLQRLVLRCMYGIINAARNAA